MIDGALTPSGRYWYLVLLELTRDILDATPKVVSLLIHSLIARVFVQSGLLSGQKSDGAARLK